MSVRPSSSPVFFCSSRACSRACGKMSFFSNRISPSRRVAMTLLPPQRSDHVEGLFGLLVAASGHDLLAPGQRLLQRDVLAWLAGVELRGEKGLRQETLQPPRAGKQELIRLGQLIQH